ncbi:MAG: subtilase family [halophilic archaeon J07HB67]|jgi:Subtilase family.|nr:MAG: subtilase family [halophilic archaeon J07HB67]
MSDDDKGMRRRGFLKTTGAAAGAAAASGVVTATPSGRGVGPRKDEIVVGVSRSPDVASMEREVARAVPGNAEIVHKNERLRYVSVKFPERASTNAKENFIETVTKRDAVKYAEKNATFRAQAAVNDPQEPDQPSLDLINARAAWDTTLGSSNVSVAVIDTGAQYSHPDLDGNFCE